MFEDVHFLGWLVTGLLVVAVALCAWVLYKVVEMDEE